MVTIIPGKLSEFRAYRPTEKGKQISDADRLKPIDNGVSSISFFQADSAGRAKPFLKAIPSPTEDPAKLAKIFEITPEVLEDLKQDPAKFEKLIQDTLAARKDYFYPTLEQLGVKTQFKLNHIVGLRAGQFKDEARTLATSLYPAGAQRDAALRAANIAARELFYRSISFDDFETQGYASFGHDAAFIHVYEKQLKALEAVNTELLTPEQRSRVALQKKQLQSEIDAIFRDKYVFHSSDMREADAEQTIGLVAIDSRTRQRISEKESTANTIVPAFEILSAEVGGEKKAIYFDAKQKKYFLDGTGTELPEPHGEITRTNVPAQAVTFRRAKDGEPLREDFRFDWNRDGYVQHDNIDWVGWAGHCNDKAALEGAGVVLPEDHPGVTVFDSSSGKKATFDRNLLNEVLFSYSELGSDMATTAGQRAGSLGYTAFAGARDDDRPDRIVLNNSGRVQIPMRDQPNKFTIAEITIGADTLEAEKAFSKYKVADDELSAIPNPLFEGLSEGDVVELNLGAAKLKASAQLQIFDEDTGYPTFISREIELDFNNPPAEPILVDTMMSDAARREMYEITLAAKDGKWNWNYQLFRMEKPEGKDKYEKVKVEGQSGSQEFDPAMVTGRHETSLDAPSTWLPFVDDAMATGVNGTAETMDGAGVWNGKMHSLGKRLEQRAKVERDGKTEEWERVGVDVEAEFGGNAGRYLAKLDARGEPEFTVPLALPADFFWRQQMVFAPEAGGLVSAKALQRGLISVDRATGSVHAEALSDFMELLHMAFSGKQYVVQHNGERFVFDTKEDFDAEVAKLKSLRSATIEGGEADLSLHVEKTGEIKAEESAVLDPIAVPEDTTVTIAIDEGSIELTAEVKKEGQETGTTHELPYWAGSKELKFSAQKGDTITITVNGYDLDASATSPEARTAKPYKLTVTSDSSEIPDTRAQHDSWF